MSGAYVIHALRSAVVPRGGAFAGFRVDDLGAAVVTALLAQAGIAPDQVDEVICANALGEGGNPARRIALAAGLPDQVAGLTTDRQCAGGLDALLLARALVMSGMAQVVLAGGVESHSRRPERRMPGAEAPYLQAPFTPWPERDPEMSVAAAALAERLGISRDRQDAWAVESHRKARQADLSAESVPVAGITQDPFARDLTPAIASRAKVLSGSITAANTAVAADGAAFVLVVSAQIAALFPAACRLSGVTLGGVPWEPGTAPIAAIRAALGDRRPEVAEVMEAYAVQAIACVDGAGLDPATVNIGGGALARGHPIGASGAVLAVRLFHQMGQAQLGVAAIAAAGGIGTALVLER